MLWIATLSRIAFEIDRRFPEKQREDAQALQKLANKMILSAEVLQKLAQAIMRKRFHMVIIAAGH